MNINNPVKVLIAILLITLVFVKQYASSANGGSEIKPKPPIKVPDNSPKPTPVVIVPELKDNFLYDDLDKAVQLGKTYKRNIVVVFGAEWCPYCRTAHVGQATLRRSSICTFICMFPVWYCIEFY